MCVLFSTLIKALRGIERKSENFWFVFLIVSHLFHRYNFNETNITKLWINQSEEFNRRGKKFNSSIWSFYFESTQLSKRQPEKGKKERNFQSKVDKQNNNSNCGGSSSSTFSISYAFNVCFLFLHLSLFLSFISINVMHTYLYHTHYKRNFSWKVVVW